MPVPAPVTLLAPLALPVGTNANPAVTSLARYAGVFGVLNCTKVSTGGAGTLDVYVQATPDGGTTWQDVAAYRFTAVGVRVFQLSQIASPGTATLAASDGALASNSSIQGPFGDQLRVKTKVTLNGDTGTFTLRASFAPVGGP